MKIAAQCGSTGQTFIPVVEGRFRGGAVHFQPSWREAIRIGITARNADQKQPLFVVLGHDSEGGGVEVPFEEVTPRLEGLGLQAIEEALAEIP